jgi:hypothetical protein
MSSRSRATETRNNPWLYNFRFNWQFFKRIITGDNMAQTPQDAVYQGAECFLQANLIEWNAAGIYSIVWPYDTTWLDFGRVGRLDVQQWLAKQIVLTAVSGPPAQNSPASITLPLTILAEGFPVEILLAPDLRIAPIRQRVYPSEAFVFGTKT